MPRPYRPKYRAKDGTTRTQRMYYIKVRGPDGKWKERPLSRDFATACRLAARLTGDADRRRGLPVLDPHKDPLEQQITDWRDAMLAAGDVEQHAETQAGRVRRVLAAGKVTTMAGLTADAVAKGVAELQRHGYETTGQGASKRKVGLRTAGYMLTACKTFAAWAAGDGRRLPFNPLAGLKRRRDKAKGRRIESTRPRRALTAEEFARLLQKTARSTTIWRGLSGRDRAMLYLTALHTGFRRSELAALMPADFRLDAKPPTVTTRGYGRAAVQTVRADAAAELAAYLKGRPADERVWPGTWSEKSAEMLRADLKAAKIPATIGGRVVDLHAIRRTGATLQIAAGADVKSVQTYMRHSSVGLTLDLYTDVLGPNVEAALSALPAVQKIGPRIGPRRPSKQDKTGQRPKRARRRKRPA